MSELQATQPLVSVILPNRNHAHYLPKALDGMLAQTWTRFELLVVDDASSDGSPDLVRRYQEKDRRVQLVPLDTHHGIHRAVQSGLAQASGEFVYIAASDDCVEVNFLQRCVEELVRFPDAGLCFSDPSEYYHDSDRAILFPLYLSERPVFFNGPVLASLFSRNYFHISPNTGIYRQAAFRAAGGYREELDLLSDWFVTMVVALRQGVVYLPEQLTYVAVRGDSYSATALRDPQRRHAALEKVLMVLASPGYEDVFRLLRQTAVLPEYHFSTLWWLLQSRSGRALLSPRLVGRIVTRASWSYLRDHTPVRWRRRLRKYASGRRSSQSPVVSAASNPPKS
ncbi:MAG: hypothetical protein JWN71_4289 [Xanthobacteraceae bacterium]|jgi:glycosyltransferase involved in cell wall biosynthesis|nr:hypothetical protein [Xanthobacteraceae bacterium]